MAMQVRAGPPEQKVPTQGAPRWAEMTNLKRWHRRPSWAVGLGHPERSVNSAQKLRSTAGDGQLTMIPVLGQGVLFGRGI